MIKVLLEYFTNIDEIGDFFQLWPTVYNYFEINLGCNMVISFFTSILVSLLIIAVPVWVCAAILKKAKTL